jgi:hypothetical protein
LTRPGHETDDTGLLIYAEQHQDIDGPDVLDTFCCDDGAVELWEDRGFPDGCTHVKDAAGDRLDCAERYRVS